MGIMQETGAPILLTATGIISEQGGNLLGWYANNVSALTIVLNVGGATTSGGTAVSGTITPAIGFHRFPMNTAGQRLYATIGGTGSVTFFFAAG